MSFPRYERYKDSGIEWLGEVPEHWEILKLARVIERNDGGAWGKDPDGIDDTIVLRSTEQTQTGEWCITDPCLRKLTEAEKSVTILLEGDLLITKSSGSALHIGKTTLVDRQIALSSFAYSNFMQRVRTNPERLLPRFAWYLLNSEISRSQFDLLSNSTTGLANINATVLNNLILAAPQIGEQRKACDFLDEQIAKIDALIDEQQRLIALLKEKRQAVISHAVTKGLNPAAPMKGSGVEWIGAIPKHWRVCRLGNLFREVAESGSQSLPILSVSIHDGVSDRQLEDSELERSVARSEDLTKYKRVMPGDLAYNMMRAWQGGFGTVLVEGMISPAYVVARPREQCCTKFIETLLRTPAAIEEMRRASKGVTDFRLRLYWEEFKDIKIAAPPVEEMNLIVQEISRIQDETEAIMQICQRAITLLQERRAALISAAVTGKIDVRNYALRETSPAPEELYEPA